MKSQAWRDFILVVLLILFDLYIHPLTAGPDRLIHDPAVYRLSDPSYLAGDWYTDMAVKSGVYVFYAKLINAWQFLRIPEELWRSLLYLSSLSVLYYALIRIARLFTKNWLVIPTLVVVHAYLNTGLNQPSWLYGPFIHIDGGIAPRSIGVAASFVALYYLLRGSLLIPSLILGLATLIHVSNSFIIFSLFLLVWGLNALLVDRPKTQEEWIALARKAGLGIVVYLLAGGWFAFYVASLGTGDATTFSAEKFVWVWVYLRAPYMALPLGSVAGKAMLLVNVGVIALAWFFVRRAWGHKTKEAFDILGLLGLGAIAYFMIFYLFAFVTPWIPGFQFYSIRVIYFAYFVAFFVASLLIIVIGEWGVARFLRCFRLVAAWSQPLMVIGFICGVLLFAYSPPGKPLFKPKQNNLKYSWYQLADASKVLSYMVPANQRYQPPRFATFNYLYTSPRPFLGPPNWTYMTYYLPHQASFKSFGFTKSGIEQWYDRLNDITGGELEKNYQSQIKAGRYTPVIADWKKTYGRLTSEEIQALAKKYNVEYIVTYQNVSYPFELLAEDPDFRLYKLTGAE